MKKKKKARYKGLDYEQVSDAQTIHPLSGVVGVEK